VINRTPFDQFLEKDYAPLARDLRGWVVDATTQAPPHLITNSQPLCDFLLHPYCEEVQLAYRGGGGALRMRAAPVQRSRVLGDEGGVGLGVGGVELAGALVSDPPSVTAAIWHCVDAGQRSEASLAVRCCCRQGLVGRGGVDWDLWGLWGDVGRGGFEG